MHVAEAAAAAAEEEEEEEEEEKEGEEEDDSNGGWQKQFGTTGAAPLTRSTSWSVWIPTIR